MHGPEPKAREKIDAALIMAGSKIRDRGQIEDILGDLNQRAERERV